jgi:hypothetical protein
MTLRVVTATPGFERGLQPLKDLRPGPHSVEVTVDVLPGLIPDDQQFVLTVFAKGLDGQEVTPLTRTEVIETVETLRLTCRELDWPFTVNDRAGVLL